MTQPLRAYIYARVSNDDEDGNNASGVAQRAACRAWCEKQGVEVVEEFEELNVSGRKLKRREFDRMIAQATAANRPVQIIVVYMLSRFARRLLTQMTAEHKLDEAGVRLVSVVEDIRQQHLQPVGLQNAIKQSVEHDAVECSFAYRLARASRGTRGRLPIADVITIGTPLASAQDHAGTALGMAAGRDAAQ